MEDEPETAVSIEAASQEVNESCSEIQVYDYRVTRFLRKKCTNKEEANRSI